MDESEVAHDSLLELESSVAFSGGVKAGLKVHNGKKDLIYSIGCSVVIEDILTGKQTFLAGHTKSVSCLAVSKSGKYIASGQITDLGFKAKIIVWDFFERKSKKTLTLHRNKVEALAFSPNDKYLVSLGGQDDGSIVVWNLDNFEAICGAEAQTKSAGLTFAIAYANTCDNTFISGGDRTLRVWELDVANRKIRATDVQMGQLKRIISCIEMAVDDSFFYCGTNTGDLIAVNMKSKNLQSIGPEKGHFSLGITSLCLLSTKDILVGAGDGTVAVVKGKDECFKKTKKQQKVMGNVTSIALRGQGHQFYVGTSVGNLYKFDFASFTRELKTTCGCEKINDLAIPFGTSSLLLTASTEDVRVWLTPNNKEVLRITVPNLVCHAVAVMKDGKSIVTGWSDAKIRAFSPETAKPLWEVNNAGGSSVTALATYNNCQKVISGSNHGHVIVWTVPSADMCATSKNPISVTKHFPMKEHKAEITCIKVTKNDEECVTSCSDGSCIIWNLLRGCRKQMIRVNTLFKYVIYSLGEDQILTTGTDRKVSYWAAFDASIVREIEGSKSCVNTMDITEDGKYFVTGGDDKIIKVWNYEDGTTTHFGIGHSAAVTGVKITPDQTKILSVGADGAIFKWKFPF